MREKVKEKSKNPFIIVWNSLVSSSNKEESDLEKQIKEIEDAEDRDNIEHLLNLVKAPSIKKARFSDKNIKAKVSSGNIRAKVLTNDKGVTTERKKQEEKSLEEI